MYIANGVVCGFVTTDNSEGGDDMLGWSIDIRREQDDTSVVYGQGDISLDHDISRCAEKVLRYNSGYPNQYLIRNDKLPSVQLESFSLTEGHQKFELGPLPDLPGDALLSVELWDQS